MLNCQALNKPKKGTSLCDVTMTLNDMKKLETSFFLNKIHFATRKCMFDTFTQKFPRDYTAAYTKNQHPPNENSTPKQSKSNVHTTKYNVQTTKIQRPNNQIPTSTQPKPNVQTIQIHHPPNILRSFSDKVYIFPS